MCFLLFFIRLICCCYCSLSLLHKTHANGRARTHICTYAAITRVDGRSNSNSSSSDVGSVSSAHVHLLMLHSPIPYGTEPLSIHSTLSDAPTGRESERETTQRERISAVPCRAEPSRVEQSWERTHTFWARHKNWLFQGAQQTSRRDETDYDVDDWGVSMCVRVSERVTHTHTHAAYTHI